MYANTQCLHPDGLESYIAGDMIEHPITDIRGVIPPQANIKRRIDHLSSTLMTPEVLHYNYLLTL